MRAKLYSLFGRNAAFPFNPSQPPGTVLEFFGPGTLIDLLLREPRRPPGRASPRPLKRAFLNGCEDDLGGG